MAGRERDPAVPLGSVCRPVGILRGRGHDAESAPIVRVSESGSGLGFRFAALGVPAGQAERRETNYDGDPFAGIRYGRETARLFFAVPYEKRPANTSRQRSQKTRLHDLVERQRGRGLFLDDYPKGIESADSRQRTQRFPALSAILGAEPRQAFDSVHGKRDSFGRGRLL